MKRYALYIGILGLAGFCSDAIAASSDPFPPGKHDNNQPIEINSDTLDVYQNENKAIFIGHVVAIQGDVRLKSDKMTVYYRKQEEEAPNKTSAKKPVPEKKKQPQAPDATPGQSAIKHIDVEGNVFLSTPEETASGISGVYDVENHQILLNDHVILTKAKNTLKGDHLVYDFATGKSTLTAGGKVQQMPGAPKGRVHALFIPENNKNNANDTKGATKDDKQNTQPKQ